MTIGHRVSRSTLKSSKAVRKLFPWAERLVRVDGVWVAYEAAEDALEEHGAVCVVSPAANIGDHLPVRLGITLGYTPHGLFYQAKRRGDL